MFSVSVFCWVIACDTSRNKPADLNDTETIPQREPVAHSVIKQFRQDEKIAMDSIILYGLQSINYSCLMYLYAIYGNEYLPSAPGEQRPTIGECNLKLVKFLRPSADKGELIYSVLSMIHFPLRLL